MTYLLTQNCPENVLVQSLPSGDYDLTHYGSIEAAVQGEASGVYKPVASDSADLRDEIYESITEYSKEEVLKATESGYGWPSELGFVVDMDELEKEYAANLKSQVERVKKYDFTTNEDVMEEIFGECDQLDILLREKEIDKDNIPIEDLRDIQHDAACELRDHFGIEI